MLIEQTLDKLNTMKLGAMADACQQQIQIRRGRSAQLRGALRPARRRRVDGPRAAQAPAAPAHRQAAPSGHSRGRRLHPSSPAQPPAGPDPRHLRMGRRTPQLDPARSHRDRKELPLLRVRRTGLSPRLHLHATSACRACCTSSPSAAATAPTLGCWPASRSSTCLPSTTG